MRASIQAAPWYIEKLLFRGGSELLFSSRSLLVNFSVPEAGVYLDLQPEGKEGTPKTELLLLLRLAAY